MSVNEMILKVFAWMWLCVACVMIQGCGYSMTQLVKINNGEKPLLTLLVSVPEEIQVESVGFTVFSNKYITYTSPSNTKQNIMGTASTLLSDSDRIQYVNVPLPDSDSLLNGIRTKHNGSVKNDLSDNEIADIAEWGRRHQLEYVALIYPYMVESPNYGRPGRPAGKGILSDVRLTYLYSSYQAFLIDTATSEITDISGVATFKEVPHFSKELSEKDVDRVTKDWEYGRDNDLLGKDENQALKEMMILASHFNGNDFATLDDHKLGVIDKDLTVLLKRNIKKNLIGIGLIEGQDLHSRFDIIKAKEDLTYKVYSFYEK